VSADCWTGFEALFPGRCSTRSPKMIAAILFYDSQVGAIIRPFTVFCILLLVTPEDERFREVDLSGVCQWCIADGLEESPATTSQFLDQRGIPEKPGDLQK